jgi:hypothetical protein
MPAQSAGLAMTLPSMVMYEPNKCELVDEQFIHEPSDVPLQARG